MCAGYERFHCARSQCYKLNNQRRELNMNQYFVGTGDGLKAGRMSTANDSLFLE